MRKSGSKLYNHKCISDFASSHKGFYSRTKFKRLMDQIGDRGATIRNEAAGCWNWRASRDSNWRKTNSYCQRWLNKNHHKGSRALSEFMRMGWKSSQFALSMWDRYVTNADDPHMSRYIWAWRRVQFYDDGQLLHPLPNHNKRFPEAEKIRPHILFILGATDNTARKHLLQKIRCVTPASLPTLIEYIHSIDSDVARDAYKTIQRCTDGKFDIALASQDIDCGSQEDKLYFPYIPRITYLNGDLRLLTNTLETSSKRLAECTDTHQAHIIIQRIRKMFPQTNVKRITRLANWCVTADAVVFVNAKLDGRVQKLISRTTPDTPIWSINPLGRQLKSAITLNGDLHNCLEKVLNTFKPFSK